MTEILLNVISVIGVVAFSVAGAIVAIDHGVDLFGVLLMAGLTSFAGGLTRDVIMDITPHLFVDRFYFLQAGISCATALAVFAIARGLGQRFRQREATIERINNVFDALGLAVFATTGADVAMRTLGDAENVFSVLTLSVLTAIGGGMLRDVCLGEIPFVLKKRIYAVAALAGAATFYVLRVLAVYTPLAMLCGIIVTFALRLLATIFRWNLPKAFPDKPETENKKS